MTEDRIEMLYSLAAAELEGCLAVLAEGKAVNLEVAKNRLPQCPVVAVRREGKEIVAVGAIKPRRPSYATDIATKVGFAFDPAMHELGYVAVKESQQGKRLSIRITDALLSQFGTQQLFATTSDFRMKRTLAGFSFLQKGKEWEGNEGNSLSLWLRSP